MSDAQPTSEKKSFEACYCKRCHGVIPVPCKYAGKNWLQLLWLRIWCAMDGHGGITPLNGQQSCCNYAGHLCKRCGATVNL
jgi:hypothetical protein